MIFVLLDVAVRRQPLLLVRRQNGGTVPWQQCQRLRLQRQKLIQRLHVVCQMSYGSGTPAQNCVSAQQRAGGGVPEANAVAGVAGRVQHLGQGC